MGSWEERFSAQQKNPTASGRQQAGPAAGAAPAGAAAQPFPPTFAEMRRHLDDIWSNLLLESKGKPDVLLFCGSTPGEGCTFLSFHLALFLATGPQLRTLYVDTAVDGTDQSPYLLDMQGRPGLISFFNGDAALPGLIAPTGYPNLSVLPSGRQAQIGPSLHKNIIGGNYIEQLVSFCRGNFDVTIVDGQPIATRPITIEFAKRIDKVVLVSRYGSSRREVSAVSAEKLRKNGINITGAILNDRQFPVPPGFYKILK